MLVNCKNEETGRIVNALIDLEFKEFINHIKSIPYTARRKQHIESFKYEFGICNFIDTELESLVTDIRKNNL